MLNEVITNEFHSDFHVVVKFREMIGYPVRSQEEIRKAMLVLLYTKTIKFVMNWVDTDTQS
jgi:hypothetical protein